MHNKIFLALLETSSAHAELSRNEFYKLTLTDGQPKILYILRRQDGYVQKELAKICGIRPSTLTVLLSKMEKSNLIRKEREIVSGGKRAYKVYLTNEGKDMADKVEDIVEKMEERSFKGFSPDEKNQLLKMLGRVSDNLKK